MLISQVIDKLGFRYHFYCPFDLILSVKYSQCVHLFLFFYNDFTKRSLPDGVDESHDFTVVGASFDVSGRDGERRFRFDFDAQRQRFAQSDDGDFRSGTRRDPHPNWRRWRRVGHNIVPHRTERRPELLIPNSQVQSEEMNHNHASYTIDFCLTNIEKFTLVWLTFNIHVVRVAFEELHRIGLTHVHCLSKWRDEPSLLLETTTQFIILYPAFYFQSAIAITHVGD